MAVTVLLDDGTGSDNGVVSVMTPVNQTQREHGTHVALELSSTTNSVALAADVDGRDSAETFVVLHAGSLFLQLRPASARLVARVLFTGLAAPLIWVFTARATALLVTIGVIMAAYEHAWLGARIAHRLSAAAEGCEAVKTQLEAIARGHNPTNIETKPSAMEEALLNIHSGIDGPNATPMLAERPSEESSKFAQSFALGINLQPVSTDHMEPLVAAIADRVFCRKRRISAVMLAVPLATLLVFVEVTALRSWTFLPGTSALDASSDNTGDFAWTLVFLGTTRFAASISSLLAPTALSGLLQLAELELFTVMSMVALDCSLSSAECSSSIDVFSLFVMGIGTILCANAIGSSDAIVVAVSSVMSVSGFVGIHCIGVLGLSLLGVEDSIILARNLIISVLFSVLAADIGSWMWWASLSKIWSQSTPIQRRLSLDLDVEGALVGAGCAMVSIIVCTQMISLPNAGPVFDYVMLTLVSTAVARFGELMAVLLAHAAGVKTREVLYHVGAPFAAALVFSQYARAL